MLQLMQKQLNLRNMVHSKIKKAEFMGTGFAQKPVGSLNRVVEACGCSLLINSIFQ